MTTIQTRRGIKLIELMVIVAIIAVVIALLLPATRKVRGAAARMECQSKLKQLSFGMLNYHDSNNAYPRGCFGGDGLDPEDRMSWAVELIPFLESMHLRKPVVAQGFAENLDLFNFRFRLFVCPSYPDQNAAICNYVALAGLEPDAGFHSIEAKSIGFMGYDRKTQQSDIRDGLSNTVGLAETAFENGHWGQGGFATLRTLDVRNVPLIGTKRPFGGLHHHIVSVAAIDGHAKSLVSTIDPQHLAALITIAGGETVVDW